MSGTTMRPPTLVRFYPSGFSSVYVTLYISLKLCYILADELNPGTTWMGIRPCEPSARRHPQRGMAFLG